MDVKKLIQNMRKAWRFPQKASRVYVNTATCIALVEERRRQMRPLGMTHDDCLLPEPEDEPLMFRGAPVKIDPELDGDPTNPIYFAYRVIVPVEEPTPAPPASISL